MWSYGMLMELIERRLRKTKPFRWTLNLGLWHVRVYAGPKRHRHFSSKKPSAPRPTPRPTAERLVKLVN